MHHQERGAGSLHVYKIAVCGFFWYKRARSAGGGLYRKLQIRSLRGLRIGNEMECAQLGFILGVLIGGSAV